MEKTGEFRATSEFRKYSDFTAKTLKYWFLWLGKPYFLPIRGLLVLQFPRFQKLFLQLNEHYQYPSYATQFCLFALFSFCLKLGWAGFLLLETERKLIIFKVDTNIDIWKWQGWRFNHLSCSFRIVGLKSFRLLDNGMLSCLFVV